VKQVPAEAAGAIYGLSIGIDTAVEGVVEFALDAIQVIGAGYASIYGLTGGPGSDIASQWAGQVYDTKVDPALNFVAGVEEVSAALFVETTVTSSYHENRRILDWADETIEQKLVRPLGGMANGVSQWWGRYLTKVSEGKEFEAAAQLNKPVGIAIGSILTDKVVGEFAEGVEAPIELTEAGDVRQKVEFGDLVDFKGGPGRAPGHARSKHGVNLRSEEGQALAVDIRNNAENVYIGLNDNGHRVAVYLKDETALITPIEDTRQVITVYGKNVPGTVKYPPKPLPDKWANHPNFSRIDPPYANVYPKKPAILGR
jgi:hypothetical protein